MRRRPVIFAALLAAFIFFWAELSAEVCYQVDSASRYIWRGFDLNPPKKPVIQPSIDIVFGESGLSLNLWSSVSFVSRKLNEFDMTLTYATSISKDVSMEAGLIHYAWYFTENFKFKDDTSHEFFLSLGLQDFILTPVLSIFYDFTVGDGIYIQLEIDHSFRLSKKFSADFTVSLGFNGGQWLAEGVDPGFSDLNFGLALPFETGRFHFSAFANYTIVLLNSIGKENHFWFGLSLSYMEKKRGQ